MRSFLKGRRSSKSENRSSVEAEAAATEAEAANAAESEEKSNDAQTEAAANGEEIYYADKDTRLTAEHLTMFNELKQHVNDVLSGTLEWKWDKVNTPSLYTDKNAPDYISSALDIDKESKYYDSTKDYDKVDENGFQYAPPVFFEYLFNFADNHSIIRHLTGCDYNLEQGKEDILKVVEWRVMNAVDRITPQMFEPMIQLKAVVSLGHKDNFGHCICYNQLLAEPLDDPTMLICACIYTVEKSIRISSEAGKFQSTWIFDLENLRYATVPPFQVIKTVAHMFQHYYPERAHHVFVVFAPYIFQMVWKMVSLVLTENTKGKIEFVSWKDSSRAETFAAYMTDDNLVEKYGGKCKLDWTYQWECQQFADNFGVSYTAPINNGSYQNPFWVGKTTNHADALPVATETETGTATEEPPIAEEVKPVEKPDDANANKDENGTVEEDNNDESPPDTIASAASQ